MPGWPRSPLIYEINTWVWLQELASRAGRAVTLASVPAEAWDALAALGIDAVWFMGVWRRSQAGIAIANDTPSLVDDFRRALPDYQPHDNVGSPYCVRDYDVDPALGGTAGLAAARQALADRGIRLLLDFVPNHVALDHPWVASRPDYFVRGTARDLHDDPASFFRAGTDVLAHGRDPNFPAWPDVLQLNAFSPALREAAIDTLDRIGGLCDGVRCDMAMLLITEIFARTWGVRAGAPPATEFWDQVIHAVRQRRPALMFIAEAYWDREWDLQQQGFPR